MKQLRRSFFIFACLLVAAVCVSTSAYSQVLYGTLVGTITDQSDAVVPKAEVTATNGATNQTYRAVTDDQGRYSIPDVLQGKYTLKVSATGFRSLVQNDFNVSINTVNRADLKLAVGQVSEQVTVEGQALMLQTDKSDVHSEISAVAIENLPLTQIPELPAIDQPGSGFDTGHVSELDHGYARPRDGRPMSMVRMPRAITRDSMAPRISTSGCRITWLTWRRRTRLRP